MLDVSDIHLLKAIVEAGSTSKAAEKLFMSQPTLSKRVARLEQQLKTQLFHRSSTGMKPTEIANYLIHQGQHIQSQLSAICRHVELLSNLEGGSLHIGVSPVVEQLLFPQVLLDFIAETTNVEISFKVEVPEKLQQAVIAGELDIAVGPFLVHELPQELFISEVSSEPVIFVVRPEHPIVLASPQPTLAELFQYPGIGPALNKSMLATLEQAGLSPKRQITCDNYHISKSIVMSSDYFTGGPKQLFEHELSRSELIEVKTAQPVIWQAYCVTRPESIHTATVKKFLEILERY